VLCFLCTLAHAQPLTTAFTYQGDLTTAGAPATGTYDLRFRLFDALAGGAQQGPTLCSDNVSVAGGAFTAQLDFGSQFAGQQRFLEIDVRLDTGLPCGNATGFTTLAPRQPLTAAPNAAFSINAASASTATNATTAANATQLNGQPPSFYQNAANLTGILPDARLSGSYSGPLSFSNSANNIAGNGAALIGLNASNLASGTLPDARLSTNVDLLNSAQVFTAAKTFSTAPSFTAAGAPFSVSSTALVTNLNADRLDGLDATAFLQSIPTPLALSGLSASHIIRADNQFSGSGASGLVGSNTSSSGFTYGVWGLNASTTGRAVFGQNTATTGPAYGTYGQTDSTQGIAVFGNATATTGPTAGGRFDNASTSGTGVTGFASAASGSTSGVYGSCNSPSGTGVTGKSFDASGGSTGVLGLNGSTAGRAVVGTEYAATGATVGVDGYSSSTSGVGVHGNAPATSGFTTGVYGENASPSGYAGRFEGPGADCVYINNTGSGRGLRITSPSDTALWAISSGFAAVDARNDATSGGVYGLIGRTSSSTGFGVYSSGNFGASGTKSFRIDHPDDPAHKYLFHYATESPEVLNAYRGTVTLNQQGEATIDLPPYFAKINKDPSYQLTPVGAAMPLLHIATKISQDALAQGAKAAPSEPAPTCSFTIAGGAPNGEVCWRVEATRNDRWVQTHGAPVEVAKQGPEDGTYQHPDLYNQPADKGAFYHEPVQALPAPGNDH
jgi:hypothetical protein